MIRAPVLNRVRLCDPFGTRISRIDIRGAQVEDMTTGFKIVAPFARPNEHGCYAKIHLVDTYFDLFELLILDFGPCKACILAMRSTS